MKKYVDEINAIPLVGVLAKELDERVGLKIDSDSYTFFSEGNKINYVEGLSDESFVIELDGETFEEMIKDKEWAKENKMEAYMKYKDKIKIPFSVKIKLFSILARNGFSELY